MTYASQFARRAELGQPALAALRIGGGQHAAGQGSGRVERVQRLVEVSRGRVLVREQQGELERSVALGERPRLDAPGTRSTSGSSPSDTGRAVERYGAR